MEAADNLSFDPLSIFLLKPNTPSEGWSFDEDVHHYPNTDITSCRPTLNIQMSKNAPCYDTSQVFREFKADFDPAHTILDKRQN